MENPILTKDDIKQRLNIIHKRYIQTTQFLKLEELEKYFENELLKGQLMEYDVVEH